MVLSLIYHIIKKACSAIIDVAAWLLVALSLWIPLVYTVIFIVWCGLMDKSLSALSTIYWAGLAITFVGSFFVSAFMYERRATAKSRVSKNADINNSESVKYKIERAELKKRSKASDETEEEPYDESVHKNLDTKSGQDMSIEEQNRLKRFIEEERERLRQKDEEIQNKQKYTKEDLLKAQQQALQEGAFGHPGGFNQNGYSQPQNPHGFAPYNMNPNSQSQPFVNPYAHNQYKSNPLSQINNPYNQPNNPNYQQSGYAQNNYGFMPYNANPYANQQPQQGFGQNSQNPYGFMPYNTNSYQIKDSGKGFEDDVPNPYDSFYNQNDSSYKVFDRPLGQDISLNSERQQKEAPRIFAVRSDPTVFIHEYADRLEYYKRTRQGMVFMKSVAK